MYAVCAFFYAYSGKLTAESKTYPMFTITLLFALTTLYLIQMIISARKFGVESGADEVFAGFKPVQFIVSVVLTIVYFFMMKYLGFFTATIVFMVASLLYLKVRPVVAMENVMVGLKKSLPERAWKMLPANEEAIRHGGEIIRKR